MQQTKPCPICSTEMNVIDQRFPNTVCDACASRAVDAASNKVEFSNGSMSGGIVATHAMPDGTTQTDEVLGCTIDGKPCHGVEFHMGGTGIELEG